MKTFYISVTETLNKIVEVRPAIGDVECKFVLVVCEYHGYFTSFAI